MGVRSFDKEYRYRFDSRSGRYTLKLTRGQIVMDGAAADGANEPLAKELAAQMSDADFVWEKPVWRLSRWYVEGKVVQGSATARMYAEYRDRLRDDATLGPPLRVWLAALEDPGKRVPAMTLLSLMADWWRIARVSDEGIESAILPLDPATGKPDVSRWKEFRERWHDKLDVPLVVVFAGWPVALMFIAPLLWIARPRWEKRTIGRRVFNAAALVSASVCVASMAGWARSYSGEQWAFHARPTITPPGTYPTVPGTRSNHWYADWTVGSSMGRLQVLRREHAESRTFASSGLSRDGYRPVYRLQGFSVGSWTGARRVAMPGLSLYVRPPQVVTAPPPPPPSPVRQRTTVTTYSIDGRTFVAMGPATVPANATRVQSVVLGPAQLSAPVPTAMLEGIHSVIIWWWLMMLVSALLPAIWLRGMWTRYRNRGRSLCPQCGYDTRFSPQRCPECGLVLTPMQPVAGSNSTV